MKTLTQAKRDQARERARSSVRRRHGAAPTYEQFQHLAIRQYPAQIQKVVYVLMLVPLLAFLLLSAMRLLSIGEVMHESVSGHARLLGLFPQALVAGITIVLALNLPRSCSRFH